VSHALALVAYPTKFGEPRWLATISTITRYNTRDIGYRIVSYRNIVSVPRPVQWNLPKARIDVELEDGDEEFLNTVYYPTTFARSVPKRTLYRYKNNLRNYVIILAPMVTLAGEHHQSSVPSIINPQCRASSTLSAEHHQSSVPLLTQLGGFETSRYIAMFVPGTKRSHDDCTCRVVKVQRSRARH
jgi:hypothetical protein